MDRVTVLCVDDDPDLVALTASLLEESNERFETITETNPRDVIDYLETASIDCVVSDYDMPEMDGVTLLESIRDEFPDLPFILFTGKGGEEVASTAIAHGVTDYLQKDTGDEQYELLANRVSNAVAQHRASRRASNLNRIRRLIRDVNQMLVRTTDRGHVERQICDVIADADPYLLACIVEIEPTTGGPSGSVEMTIGEADGVAGGWHVRTFAVDADETAATQNEEVDGVVDCCPIDAAIESGSIETATRLHAESPATTFDAESLSCAAVPIQYDGQPRGILCLVADRGDAFDSRERNLIAEISEDLGHAIYRIELQDRQQRFERIISNLPVGVYRNAPLPDGTLLEVNPALVEMFDADSEDELLGRPFRELYADPADREQFVSKLKRDGIVHDMQLEFETLSGESFEASVTGITTIEDDDRYFDGIVQDVSERDIQTPEQTAIPQENRIQSDR
ncbi:MAG: response regulator [Halorhabdus sp.]